MKVKGIYLLGILSAIMVLLGANLILALDNNRIIAPTVIPAKENILTVTGEGKISEKPDLVTINLGVLTEGKEAQEAVEKNSEKMNEVIKALKEFLEDREIKTTYYSLYPKYYYQEGREPIIVGYVAQNNIRIETKKIDLAGKIIDLSVEKGVNQIQGIHFSFSEELKKDLKLKLIKMAVEDAKEKAQTLIDSLGVKILGIKSIQIVEEGVIIGERIVPQTSLSTPIQPGEETLSLRVTIEFIIG
ncbi:26 kDa periplasmic immunogenic protein [archaeon HR06]|nr:26 kDa periplasmic immunogenic protein [archaeon HR06]